MTGVCCSAKLLPVSWNSHPRPQHPYRGDPRSGKSWITGLFCEQLILQGYCLCMIDPEGDYATLESLPGVAVFGGQEPPPRLSDVARALRYPEISIVIDLSAITHEEKLAYIDELLPMLAALRRSIGLPHWIVVDEAHYFLHQPDVEQRVDLSWPLTSRLPTALRSFTLSWRVRSKQ